MNICFLARPSFDRYSIAILKKLREKYDPSIGGYFITSNANESKFVKTNINNAIVCETSLYIREHWNEFSLERLVEFENKYDCKPIWKYIYTDRFLINRNYDYTVELQLVYFHFLKKYLVKIKLIFTIRKQLQHYNALWHILWVKNMV